MGAWRNHDALIDIPPAPIRNRSAGYDAIGR